MTRADHKIIFMALGFLAVILRDVPRDRQAMRAAAIAKLIENFCMDAVAADLSLQPADAANTGNAAPNAGDMTSFFASLVSDNENNKNMVREAMNALQHCLAGDDAGAAAASAASLANPGA